MTKQEFLQKYGDIEVTFSEYYKFTFTYTAEMEDGSTLSVSFGGNADDIYREAVSNNDKQLAINLYPYQGSVCKDGKELEGFYDY